MRTLNFPLSDTDAVHIYSDEQRIWLQLRRDVPTLQDIGKPSFKCALAITPTQAIAIAGELLTAAAHHQTLASKQPAAALAAKPKQPSAPAKAPAVAAAKSAATPKQVKLVAPPPRKLVAPAEPILHPANHAKPWTPDEEQQLCAAYDAKTPIPEIARQHQRGIGGVEGKLVKLGKLTPEQKSSVAATQSSPSV